MTRRILLELGYDGTHFNGWQVQAAGRTVQGALEAALEHIHGHRVVLHAAGRTDSGVHARRQFASFDTDHPSIPAEKFREALNTQLPLDVRVMRSRAVSPGFHARFDAVSREYRYYLLHAEIVPPHLAHYCVRIKAGPDLAAWNRMAAALCGEHDFTTFASPSAAVDHHVRTVCAASFFAERGFIVFRIVANGFLWKMVRSVVGTIIGMDPPDVDSFREILHARDRSRAGTTAPARGLFLHDIRYE